MNRFIDPFTTPWFLEGLRSGGVALIVGMVLAMLWRIGRTQPAPIVGALIVVASISAMPVARPIPTALLQGIGLLAIAGALFPVARRIPVLPALLTLPGAWWIVTRADLPVSGWRLVLLFVLIAVGAPLAASFDRHNAHAFGPVVFALAILGSFTTLPDTEEVLVLVGVVVPLTLLSWPVPLARLGAFGIYPAIGMFAWVIAWGGRGRDTAIIGAVAGLGLLAVEPIVRWIRGRTLLDRLPQSPLGTVLIGGGQLLVVLATARLAGLQTDVAVSGAMAVGILAAAALAISAQSGWRID